MFISANRSSKSSLSSFRHVSDYWDTLFEDFKYMLNSHFKGCVLRRNISTSRIFLISVTPIFLKAWWNAFTIVLIYLNGQQLLHFKLKQNHDSSSRDIYLSLRIFNNQSGWYGEKFFFNFAEQDIFALDIWDTFYTINKIFSIFCNTSGALSKTMQIRNYKKKKTFLYNKQIIINSKESWDDTSSCEIFYWWITFFFWTNAKVFNFLRIVGKYSNNKRLPHQTLLAMYKRKFPITWEGK